jgi:hypothetical protein
MDSKTPGRVNLQAENATQIAGLPGFQYESTTSSSAQQDGIRGNWEPNLLNQTFFSQANFQIVQNKVRFEVFQQTGKIIDEQSADDLFMIMRAIYLTYGKNLPTQIKEQVEELNNRVSDWCVPKIVAEVQIYGQYLKDINTMPVPMAHPVSLSSAGTKSKPFKTFFESTDDAF